jgi:hypothetical protein
MKLLTISLLLFVICDTRAQFSAIGPFVPGKTTTKIIDSIASAHSIKLLQTADVLEIGNTDLSGNTGKIFEILHSCEHNDSVVYSYSNPIHNDHALYQIDYLTVSGLLFSSLELHFWKDTLYSIQFDINGEKFREAISRKYGEKIIARKETKRKNIVCRNGAGDTFNEEEVLTTMYYKTSKMLSAWTAHSKYFNSECEAVYSDYFVFMNINTDELVQAREKAIEAEHRLAQRKKD